MRTGEYPWPPVVLRPESALDVETLDRWLDELPRNASGKVTKGALRENDPA